MTLYTEKALSILKNSGLRITKPRRLVIELLAKTSRSLSAYEIKEALDQDGHKVDTVSIYRIIDCLYENHLIHRVLTTGKVMKCKLENEHECELNQSDHCHHFLICQQCGSVEEVHCPGIDSVVSAMEEASGYRINRHYLEFSGICPQCNLV